MHQDETKTLLLAANALYLNRAHFVIQRHLLSPELRKDYAKLDREDCSSFNHLRDCISEPGLIDGRLERPFQQPGPLPWQDQDLQDLISSDADIARLSLRDLPLSDEEIDRIAGANGGTLSWQDREVPLCRWWPGEVVWVMREIVIDRLEKSQDRGPAPTGDGGSAGGSDAPLGQQGSAIPLPTRKAKAGRWMVKCVRHFEESGRRVSAEQLEYVAMEDFDLSKDAVEKARRAAFKKAKLRFKAGRIPEKERVEDREVKDLK